jgi:hypothetical protein
MTSRLERLGYVGYRRNDAAAMRMLWRDPLPVGRLGAGLSVTRAGGQRDAFPSGDPSLQAALAHLGLRAPAANWRPWLALAAAHLMAYGDTLVRALVLV